MEISDEVWETCLENIHHCSINTRHNLVQFKTVHRLHYSKAKIHKIFPNVSGICNKCNSKEGTLSHQFFTCAKLYSYWTSIFDFFSKAFGKKWEPDPLVAILCSTNNHELNVGRDKWAVYLGMVLAKKMILQMWKAVSVPTFEMWLRGLGEILHLERLRYKMAGRSKVFDKVWNPVLQCLGDMRGDFDEL